MRAIVPIGNIARRVPEAGRIRIGKKVKGRNSKGKEFERPDAIGEFRFTSHDAEALTQIAAMYGGTVRPWSDPKAAEGQHEVITDAAEIRIVLPPDPLGETPIYELWGGGGCERRCDGLTATVLQHGPDGLEPIEVPCLCNARGEMACSVVTRLNVILPEVRFAGVWRLDTKSWNAAQELPGMVELIQQMQGRGLSYATLAIKQRRSIAGGETKKFMVPVLGVGASIEQLAAGQARLSALNTASAPAGELEAGEVGAGEVVAPASSAPAAGSIPVTEAPPPPDLDDEVVDAEIVDDEPSTSIDPDDCSLCGQPWQDGTAVVRGDVNESRFVHKACVENATGEFEPMTDMDQRALHALLRAKYGVVGPARHPKLTELLGREITSAKQVSHTEARALIARMNEMDNFDGGEAA
jgi:hypothetical protein